MKKFMDPEIIMMHFDTEDILTTSQPPQDEDETGRDT